MAMLEHSKKQKIITSTFMSVLLLEVCMFVGLLIMHASKLSSAPGNELGAIGSIKLFELYKTPISSGGYSAGMQINYNGLGILLGIAVIVASIISFFRIQKQ